MQHQRVSYSPRLRLTVVCRDVLTSMTVALGTSNTRFSASLNNERDISVSGIVKAGHPFLSSVGKFDVDIIMEVSP